MADNTINSIENLVNEQIEQGQLLPDIVPLPDEINVEVPAQAENNDLPFSPSVEGDGGSKTEEISGSPQPQSSNDLLVNNNGDRQQSTPTIVHDFGINTEYNSGMSAIESDTSSHIIGLDRRAAPMHVTGTNNYGDFITNPMHASANQADTQSSATTLYYNPPVNVNQQSHYIPAGEVGVQGHPIHPPAVLHNPSQPAAGRDMPHPGNHLSSGGQVYHVLGNRPVPPPDCDHFRDPRLNVGWQTPVNFAGPQIPLNFARPQIPMNAAGIQMPMNVAGPQITVNAADQTIPIYGAQVQPGGPGLVNPNPVQPNIQAPVNQPQTDVLITQSELIDKLCHLVISQGGQGTNRPAYKPAGHTKPKSFSGESDFFDWMTSFELLAERNEWDDQEKRYQLQMSLEKDALAVVGNALRVRDLSYQEMKDVLQRRFSPSDCRAISQAELEARKREKGESVRAYADALMRLALKACPNPQTAEMFALLTFKRYVTQDKVLIAKMHRKDLQDLASAVSLCVKYESSETVADNFVNTTSKKPVGKIAVAKGTEPVKTADARTQTKQQKDDYRRKVKPHKNKANTKNRGKLENDGRCFNCSSTQHWIADCDRPLNRWLKYNLARNEAWKEAINKVDFSRKDQAQSQQRHVPDQSLDEPLN